MNNSKKTAKKYSSPEMQELLDDLSEVEMMKVEAKMKISAKIADLMTIKGLNKSQFALKTDKHRSEVTKWLSGTQNFTIETLIDISNALDVNIASLLSEEPIQFVFRRQYVMCATAHFPTISLTTPIGIKGHSAFSKMDLASERNLLEKPQSFYQFQHE